MSAVARTTSRSSSPGSRGSRLGRSHPGVRRCEAVREYPVDPAAASALYSLGRLQADPASGFPSYRAAHAAFSRRLTDFPKSRWEADARAWRATLGDPLAREEEAPPPQGAAPVARGTNRPPQIAAPLPRAGSPRSEGPAPTTGARGPR